MSKIAHEKDVALKNRERPQCMSRDQQRLTNVQTEAAARLRELSIPTTRHEDWRFTNIAPLGEIQFEPAEKASEQLDQAAVAETYLFAGQNSCRLVFINGRFTPQLSGHGNLPASVKVLSLADALHDEPELLAKHLAHHADHHEDYFTAWNTASFTDGAVIHVSAGIAVETPIELLYITIDSTAPVVSHPRNLFILDDQSQATLFENYAGSNEQTYLTNAVTEAVLGENAILDHYKLQREDNNAYHVGTLHATQSRDSRVRTHSIALGAALARNNLYGVLNGEGSDCGLRGLSVGRHRQLIDHFIRVEHNQPHCSSREYFKGIYDDQAHGVFSGRIYVAGDAQHTDAKQTNRSLLLSDKAHVNTKPQLEIFADDVKCTHGATIGQIDPESLFYLRARGIEEEQARNLLIRAFASEVTDTISIESLRNWMTDWLTKRLTRPQKIEGQ